MADEAVAEHPAEPAAPKAKDARSPEAPRGGARGDDNAKDTPDAPGSDTADAADAEAAEREKERERAADRFKDRTRDPLAEEQGEEEPTDAAAATRARRSGQKLLASGRDLIGFDRSDVGRLHIGDINIGLDARRSGLSMRDGPVPEEELLRIRRTHIEPEGYVRLRRALEARRLLVLGGAPGTGRASTALALLEEVTRGGEGGQNSERVRRADPEEGVRGLATQVVDGRGGHPRGTGYLLEPALDRPGTLPPDGMDLDQLASALAQQGSYAVVVVSVGSAANPLLAGRYGAICPPAPTRELVAVRLRQRLEEEHGDPGRVGGGDGDGGGASARDGDGDRDGGLDRHADPDVDGDRGADRDRDGGRPRHVGLDEGRTRGADQGGDRHTDLGADGDRRADRPRHGGPDDAGALSRLLERAAELREDPEVTEAVGLDDLRPAEAELFASLLAGHLLGSVGREELLSGCRGLAAVQAYEWFAGVDRALAAPPPGDGRAPVRSGTAALFHPVAFRIALAVLGGASHSAVSAAAHLLTWELSVQSDPDSTPARPLFCDDPESDLALSRARPDNGPVDVAGAEVTGRLIFYRGAALPAAVLAELWDRHFPVRAPVVRWLRLLADDPRPQVSMRAAVAAGELSVRDFEHGYAELVRPLAEAPTPRRRVFAATALDQAAGHASHRRAVRKVVEDWSRHGTPALRWTAAMALGYGRSADSMDDTLDALARIGVRDDGEQLAVASLNVVRLLTLPECATVLRRLADWTGHHGEEYQDLALVSIVRLALTDVDEVLDDEPGTPLGDRGDWPLLLALAATRPELTGKLADLFWTALNTARSRDVAFDALETLLRSASRKDGREWTREGLAALLPALTAEEHDRRRLDWLLRRMMRDQDRPLTEERARALWRLAVPARQRRSEEEESHG
ncbi:MULTISPECIES: hypothetical protein [Streptomyces]|uniref:hypothetical protein n=1 Tax=Streptomyces TaxID=1883 RepID=UPI0009404CC4|nr:MULTISPECIES: hypothetical protein [unclassified Streptomyces]OKJ14333.1 hypothetical protein AMK20_00370 [Streptomyces sp. TSRI0261]QNQ35484.1 hypothetical protein HYC88_18460 [Streptomyces sp. CB00271]